MDFTNVKLFINPLRQDMSTNVKYFSTGGCYSNSKFFKNDLDSISNHLLKLTTTKLSNLNGGFGSDFHEQRMIPTIISLKNVINSLPLNNIYTNLTTELMNSTTTNTTTSDTNSTTNIMMSHLNNLTDFDEIELRKSLSPKRFYNNQQLQHKVKSMKKSPNLMFYRNLIEEIAADRKMVGKILLSRNDEEEEIGVESISTPSFVIIENTNHNKFIDYEIRFHEAKRKKLPHKIFQKCTDNAAKFGEPINILELENGSHNQISHSNGYNQESSTTNDHLEDDFEMININNEFMNTTEQLVDDESDDEDDDSFIEFDDISDNDGSDSDEDDDDNIIEVNGCFKNNNNVTNITRTRLLSDCDSEDSFIIFAEDNDEDTNDQNRMALIQEVDEESGDENGVPPAEDVTDCSPRLKKIQFWDDMLEKTIEKKVHFKPDSELCIVHPMVQWSFAYQNARKGTWEEAARDRSRFQYRLRRLSDILKPILANEHRNKIYTERFQDNT